MPSCLIVDDSKVVRKLERRIMEELGFTVSEAEDGQKAVEYCVENKANMPDMILLDWHMPVMNGLEFVKALRAMPSGDFPKVIFCTTESEMGNIMQALESGANEYIMKPFDGEIVKGKLEQIGMAF
ncbi:MAG: response regulator [Pseudomonadota bacterium]